MRSRLKWAVVYARMPVRSRAATSGRTATASSIVATTKQAVHEIDRTLLGIALERLEAGTELLDEVAERAGVAPAGTTGDLSEAVGRLEAVAHTDDLTGLHNRRSWIDTVRRELTAGGAS